MRRKKIEITSLLFLFLLIVFPLPQTNGQPDTQSSKQEPKIDISGMTVSVKLQTTEEQDAIPITIPITARWKEGKDIPKGDELMPLGELTVKEDGDEQTIISIRSIGSTPLYLAILIQDDVVNSINNEIRGIGEFIEKLPKGSRVMVGYIRSGSLQVRQKFTTETNKAVKALRIPLGSPSAAPYNPYVEIIEALKRFDSQPSGRRAIMVVSDGLDISQGASSSSPGQSVDLERAIREAQRRSVAIYSIYAPTVSGSSRNSLLSLNGQSSLQRLSDETGGYAFIRGTGTPVSFDPFLKKLGTALYRQISLTYLSTHPKKGYHKIQVLSNQSNIKIDHPAGYIRK